VKTYYNDLNCVDLPQAFLAYKDHYCYSRPLDQVSFELRFPYRYDYNNSETCQSHTTSERHLPTWCEDQRNYFARKAKEAKAAMMTYYSSYAGGQGGQGEGDDAYYNAFYTADDDGDGQIGRGEGQLEGRYATIEYVLLNNGTNQTTFSPIQRPTEYPSSVPSSRPSLRPQAVPTLYPNYPTSQPSSKPSLMPSSQPSQRPSMPTSSPSHTRPPTLKPTTHPPTRRPTTLRPSRRPTMMPSGPTFNPTSYVAQAVVIGIEQNLTGISSIQWNSGNSSLHFNVLRLALYSILPALADGQKGVIELTRVRNVSTKAIVATVAVQEQQQQQRSTARGWLDMARWMQSSFSTATSTTTIIVTPAVQVIYTITIPDTNSAGYLNADDAVNATTILLQHAVKSGELLTAIKAQAAESNKTNINASFDGVYNTSVQIVYTSVETLPPPSQSKYALLSGGAIAGIVIAVVAVIVLFAFYAYNCLDEERAQKQRMLLRYKQAVSNEAAAVRQSYREVLDLSEVTDDTVFVSF